MLKFIKELFSNPDGSASTKRTMGWMLMISALVIIFALPTHVAFEFVVTALLSTAVGSLGLSTIDYNYFLKDKTNQQNNINGNTNG